MKIVRCSVTINPAAGKPADPSILVNIPKLITDYYELRPDPSDARQRVVFGTSGHRGSAMDAAFNEWRILAITQAICDYRKLQKIDGTLFLGMDTHAVSEPAFASAMEVLAANDIDVMLSEGTPYTPNPAVSHAILVYNRARKSGLTDGIVITPSHNPPDDGGFKYDPPHGGPADSSVTSWIESKANGFLEHNLEGVRRTQFAKALRAPTTHKARLFAYFSMEFMLSEALPIYSGGLGNVAGDQLKAASNLAVPVIGIGLLCQQGYFRQEIDKEGHQHALYPFNDPGQLQIKPVREPDGEWLRLVLPLPGFNGHKLVRWSGQRSPPLASLPAASDAFLGRELDGAEQGGQLLGVNGGHVLFAGWLKNVREANFGNRVPLAVAVGDGVAQHHTDNLQNSLS
jgi:hypothetical protein